MVRAVDKADAFQRSRKPFTILPFNSLVINLIIHECALPISLVYHPAFRAFLADMDPKSQTYSVAPATKQGAWPDGHCDMQPFVAH